MKKEFKIPTILGLIVLFLGLVGGVILSLRPLTFRSRASGDCQPTNLQVTNLTHTSLDVSFTTSAPCSTTLRIDSRVIPNTRSLASQKTHYFQINNLQENTDYSFGVIGNGITFEDPNFKARTATKPRSATPTSNLAWGRVLNPDLSPAANTIVYLAIPGAMPLSALVTSNGNWNISLANSFTDQKNDWFIPPPNTPEDIFVVSEDGQTTQITNTTTANNPVPDIIIGQNFLGSDRISPPLGQVEAITPLPLSPNLTVQNPNEGETITSDQPDFFGTAPLGSTLEIKVESPDPITGKTTPATDGSWHWSPPTNLTPGEHTLTITALGQTIVRKFFVAPLVDALAFSSSPSATLVPTVIPSPVPTSIPVPTEEPTSTPIIRTAKISPTAPPPVSGVATPTWTILIFAVFLVIVSFSIFR